MQPSVSIAQQLPVAASSMPLASTTAEVGDQLPSGTTGFGDALGKLLAAVAAANQPPAPTDAATAVAQATDDPPASVPTPQPGQTLSGPPVACALPPPETAVRAPGDAEACKVPPDTKPVRRGTPAREIRAPQPVDQQAAPANVPPLPVATPPLPDSRLEPAPPPPAAALVQKEAVETASPSQTIEAPAAPKMVSSDATSPPLLPDVPADAQAHPTSSPTMELTPHIAVVLPEPVAQSTPSPLAATGSASPSHAASPTAQVAPALVQMGHAVDGTQRLTVRLDPPELGHVQVRIDRPPEAPARVEITVEKPETLTLLLRDQPQLQHALDLAGVPAEGRSVTFHVASPEPASHNGEPATAPAPGVAAGGLSGDGSHGAPRQGGQSGRQHVSTQDGIETEFTPTVPTGWLRGGLDITA